MKKIYKLLYPALAFASMAFVLITACQKLDFGTVTKSNIQNVTVRDASTVKVEMQIFDLSDDAHPDYGVCYSETNLLPTVADSKVAKGVPGTIKTDSIILHGLQPGSKIYIRAFVMNGSNPKYSFNVKDATLPQLPATTTLAASNISQTAVTLNGTVNASNNTTTVIFEYGTTTTYGQTINAIPDTVTGTTNTSVSASLTGLQANTSYHFHVKASCANGISFGNDITFTTSEIALPVVTTAEVTNITTTSATSGGNVTGDGGSAVTARGVCWSTSLNPTITGSHTTNGVGTGTWVSELAGLTPYTTYFVRAYATNSAGTAYGNELQFTTDVGQMPTVTTATITNITTTTASGGGNVTDQGATPVTTRGVCWSTSSTPTIAGNHTTDGTGTGSFTSNLTTLLPATTYYVRAYATNSAGTTYGNQVQFTTNSDQMPTVTTAGIINVTTTTATGGGNVTAQGTSPVTARGVCWSTSANPSVTNSHTTNGIGTGNFVSDITGLTASTVYYVRAYATNNTGTAYGNQVQFTTNSDQVPVVTTSNITNITPTTATGGGNVTAQGTTPVTTRGVCWSTSANPTITGSHTSNGSGLGNFTSDITGLTPATIYYVRAYATNTAGTAYGNQVQFTSDAGSLPTVTTATITDITATTATGGGNVIAQGTTAVTARGVCWSTSTNPTIAGSHTTNGSGTGSFISNLTGLSPTTTYYVRGYATNAAGTAYGNQVNFTSLSQPFTCGDLVNYSGQNYSTILIGTQCWFKENLNIGVRINGSSNQTNNGTIEKYCNSNLSSNCSIYGGLYQWNEMMQYSTTPGAQGICPSGWHLPTDDEWTVLVTYLGGGSVAGGKMKETGTLHWIPPNTGATNSSGFTGLPGGYGYPNGTFGLVGYSGDWWTSSEDGDVAWKRYIYNEYEWIGRDHEDRVQGCSVRCLSDN